MSQQDHYDDWAHKQQLMGRRVPQEELIMTEHAPGTVGFWVDRLSQYPADTQVKFIGGAICLIDPVTGEPAKPYDMIDPVDDPDAIYPTYPDCATCDGGGCGDCR